ncbi:MAG: hypothetical protein M3Z36_05015 [Acidobacteriota bacterium]|nr:hypothetical protein [Acidobacteriota bacterium]
MNRLKFVALSLLAVITLQGDLASIKSEGNLEKRARLAIENAENALKNAQSEYDKGAVNGAAAAISEMRESIEVAHASLAGTGKNPVRNPKHFKNAELKSRALLKRLDNFEQSMDFEDRKSVEPAKVRIQEIHDEWLLGIMGHKK